MSRITEHILVSASFSDESTGSVIVARPVGKRKAPYILNAFSGEEAKVLYKILVTQNITKLMSEDPAKNIIKVLIVRYGYDRILKIVNSFKKEDESHGN